MQSPTLSIITITYNNLHGLEKTLKSIGSLEFNNFEHIIIDGASTDNTLDFIKKYNDHPIKYKSEKDKGIYDAMNKGIAEATGTWIIFMNAGDTFNNANCLTKTDFLTDADVLYGDSEIQYPDGFRRIKKVNNIESIWKELPFTHQAVICKTMLVRNHLFNLNYKYCADFEQLFSLFQSHANFKYLEKTISNIEAGGVSDYKRHKATAEVFRINKQLNHQFKIYPYFIFKIIKGFLIVSLKSLLPQKIRSKMLKKKYQT